MTPALASVPLHDWNVSQKEAHSIQRRLAPLVSTFNFLPEQPRLVAGLDLSPPDAAGRLTAAAVLLGLPDLDVIQVQLVTGRTTFPYVPGLLAFREAPLLLEAMNLLGATPDFVMVNGHGVAHPRRFGLACHLGVLTGIPTFGCASRSLVGYHDPPGPVKGSWTLLMEETKPIGAVLRTRTETRPIFVSIGHGVDLDTAIKWTLACCPNFRFPEPLWVARSKARQVSVP